MKRFLALASMLLLPAVGIPQAIPGESTSAIQAAMNAASLSTPFTFAAGPYSITAQLQWPCGLSIKGPTVSPVFQVFNGTSTNEVYPATADLQSTFVNNTIFNQNGCSTPETFEYMHLQNTGGIFFGGSNSNVTIKYNIFDHMSTSGGQGKESGIYFAGYNVLNTISNFDIEWNTFGDPTSCTSPTNVMTSGTDLGGLCTGILFDAGMTNITVANNVFTHLENGFKIVCTGAGPSNCEPPSSGGTQVNASHVHIFNNDFSGIHRIASEIQIQPFLDLTLYNNTQEHQTNTEAFSMGFSNPCCNDGATAPGETSNNNVFIWDTAPNGRNAYTIEWWGKAAQANQNLVQGYTFYGFAWGYGLNPGGEAINNIFNVIAGGTFKCYICDEGYGAGAPTTITGNIENTTIITYTSVSPTISPAAGSYSSPITVTLTDPGQTSGAGPLGNTSIFYTTDGSTPTIGGGTTQIYTGPFSLAIPATVKTIGMFGAGGNTYTYPSGYGYTPSPEKDAVYTSGGVPPLNDCNQANTGSVNTLTIGGTAQQILQCTYLSGPTPLTCSPTADANGNVIGHWTSTNPAIITVGDVGSGSPGLVTAIANGVAGIQAQTSTGFVCHSWTFNVSSTRTLSSMTIATTGGVTSLQVPNTNQMIPTCVYSDGSSDGCPGATIAWTSSNGTAAPIGASTGLVTASAAGSSNIGASISSVIAPVFPLLITPATGPHMVLDFNGVNFSGKVQLQ